MIFFRNICLFRLKTYLFMAALIKSSHTERVRFILFSQIGGLA
jgi:hypothetical protein